MRKLKNGNFTGIIWHGRLPPISNRTGFYLGIAIELHLLTMLVRALSIDNSAGAVGLFEARQSGRTADQPRSAKPDVERRLVDGVRPCVSQSGPDPLPPGDEQATRLNCL